MNSTNDSLPLVSVIVSSYNHADYIEECLLSIIGQTYKNIELIVIDDGSKDNSAEIISELAEKYNFSFLTQENKGLTKTLNAMWRSSKGQYIIPFGSDDVMLPERVALQVDYMRNHPETGICGGNIELIDSKGQLYPEKRQNRNIPFRRMNFEDVFLELKPYVPATTLFIRREALEKVDGFDENIRLEDLMIELKITYAGYFIDCLGVPLAKYRKHESNTYKNHKFMIESILATYECFKEHSAYETVKYKALNSMFLKVSNRDKLFAKELLKKIPFKFWTKKTWRGLSRLYFSPEER